MNNYFIHTSSFVNYNNFINSNVLILSTPYNLPSVNKIVFESSIHNSFVEKNVSFSKSLWLIEKIGIRKSFVKKYKSLRMGRNDRRVNFSSQLFMRHSVLINFIYSFNLLMAKRLKKKLISLPNNLNLDLNYFFIIKDINVFPGLLEEFFKWQFFISFRIHLVNFEDNKNLFYFSKYYLQNLGFLLV